MFCLRRFFLRLRMFEGSPVLRFRSTMAAQTSAMARAFFFFRCPHRYFGLRCSYPLYRLLMLPRGRGRFQKLLRTWSPLQERCCASHDSKAHAACFTLHTVHLHQPHALPKHAKHTLPPLRARCHAAAENFGSSLRVLQTLHHCDCSHVAQIR